MTLYVCSSNQSKLSEIVKGAAEFGPPNLIIAAHPRLGEIPPPEENGASFEEIASNKAVYYSGFTPELALADDSGLQVSALSDAPGIYSARFAGVNATDSANNERLLRRLENHDDRKARFVCFLAVARAGRVLTTTSGAVKGEILRTPRGEGGFGYDPLFFYPALGRTFAELTSDEKFQVSHRGQALRALFTQLANAL